MTKMIFLLSDTPVTLAFFHFLKPSDFFFISRAMCMLFSRMLSPLLDPLHVSLPPPRPITLVCFWCLPPPQPICLMSKPRIRLASPFPLLVIITLTDFIHYLITALLGYNLHTI